MSLIIRSKGSKKRMSFSPCASSWQEGEGDSSNRVAAPEPMIIVLTIKVCP